MDGEKYNFIVIGSGPGGYVAAIRAAQLGQTVAIIEAEDLGGVCLNWGCIPTKALLHSAQLYHQFSTMEKHGFSAGPISFHLDKLIERSRMVARRLNGGIGHLMKKNKITVLKGYGRLTDIGKVSVDDGQGKILGEYQADHIILATGARARDLPHIKAGGHIWTAREAMIPDTMPKSVLVIGSGAIGVEFASFYRIMGSAVTIVEILEQILPVEDAEISALARKSFTRQKMTIHTSAAVEKVEPEGDLLVCQIKTAKGEIVQEKFDRVILAVGITGNVENLGLEKIGVAVEKNHIVNDGFGRTNIQGIYAIGDVTGPPWLAHKASHEAIACVEKICGSKNAHPLDRDAIAGCTYCIPQIASIGLSEKQAQEAGYAIKIGRFAPAGNGKAIAMGESEGLVKTIFDAKSGALLGAHMIGAEVTEMIQGFVIARKLETTEQELMATVFPHPTMSEMMHESVLDAYDRAIHM